ncbi:MAG: OmpH family outer membrane protein [Prevotella sp.]|jgi:outer membrane protein|nr:OmpH family outer membrane protein [Prevotella sp.]
MLKKLIILLFVIAPVSVLAQDKLAYIITNEVFMQMPELKEVESKLATKQEEIKKNISAMEKLYNETLESFKNSTDSLSQSVIADRQKQIESLQDRYETYVQNSSKELETLRQQLLTPVQQKFQKAVQDVGAEQGYTYIIDASAVLYVSPGAVNAGPFVKTKLGIK